MHMSPIALTRACSSAERPPERCFAALWLPSGCHFDSGSAGVSDRGHHCDAIKLRVLYVCSCLDRSDTRGSRRAHARG
jgi:hypothetical protein